MNRYKIINVYYDNGKQYINYNNYIYTFTDTLKLFEFLDIVYIKKINLKLNYIKIKNFK